MNKILETALHLNDAIDKICEEIASEKYQHKQFKEKIILVECLEKMSAAKRELLEIMKAQKE